jgi:beta-lactamase regulating signal transducer with metallopeptidase domain
MEANLMRQLISTGPADVLIASAWQGLLLTAFAWACLKLGPGLRASVRFSVWLIVFLLVALLPCFALFRSLSHVASSGAPAGFALQMNPAWAIAIEAAWLIASLFSITRLLSGALQMRAMYRNSTVVPFEGLTTSGSRPVEIRLSDAVDAPSVIGFFQPAVVVPRSLWSELSAAELKQVILHEIAHLDRGDDWTNLIQKLLRSLCPLNPALVWAERQLCREREQACDDAVLDAAGNARDYASCLTRLAENRLVRRAAALAPGLWKRHSELAARVENILHRRRALPPIFSYGFVAASLLLSLSGAVALQRCPGLIIFASQNATAAAFVPPQAERATGTPAANLIPARYENHTQPRLQNAMFYTAASPLVNTGKHDTGKQVAIKSQIKKVHRLTRPVEKMRNVQLMQMSSDAYGGEHLTLIVFTVDIPQNAGTSTISFTSNWIAFQI